MARRIALIFSDPKIRDAQLEKLRTRLINKNYPEHLINDSIEKAKTYDRDVLLQYKKQEVDKNSLTLVLDHNPRFIDPSHKIKEACQKLNQLEKVKAGKKSVPRIITAKRQPPTFYVYCLSWLNGIILCRINQNVNLVNVPIKDVCSANKLYMVNHTLQNLARF